MQASTMPRPDVREPSVSGAPVTRAPIGPLASASSKPSIKRRSLPVRLSRWTAMWCQLPSLIEVVLKIVVSGSPTPKASLLPMSEIPMSLVTPATLPSRMPWPSVHCGPAGWMASVLIHAVRVKVSPSTWGIDAVAFNAVRSAL